MARSPQEDWMLWQLADSAFPAGGFAHSGGLEAAWRHGETRGGAGLGEFIRSSLVQTCGAALPFLNAAHRASRDFDAIDRLCDTFTTNHVANRASRLQGKALLATSDRAFASPERPRLRANFSENAFCHFAPVFGVVSAWLAIDVETAGRLYLFAHARGLVSAGVRLGIVGPLEGQGIQANLAGATEEAFRRWRERGLDELAQTAPLLDIWQGAHDRLYSRLFQS